MQLSNNGGYFNITANSRQSLNVILFQTNSNIEEDNQDEKSIEGSCKECGKVFATVKHLFNHCKREHPDLPEICPVEPVRLGPIRYIYNVYNRTRNSCVGCP